MDGWSLLQKLRCEVGTHPEQDALPVQGHPHPRSLRLGQGWHASSPHMHIFGMWEEARVPGEITCSHGENVQTLARNQLVLLINILTKWHGVKWHYSRTCCTLFRITQIIKVELEFKLPVRPTHSITLTLSVVQIQLQIYWLWINFWWPRAKQNILGITQKTLELQNTLGLNWSLEISNKGS